MVGAPVYTNGIKEDLFKVDFCIHAGPYVTDEYVKMPHRITSTEPHEGVRYHHIDAPAVNGVEVEAHFRPLFLDSPLRNWRLQRWFRENEQFNLCSAKFAQKGQTPLCKKSVGELVESIPTPTVSFNAVYQLCHIYRHLFDEGIGLRQLLDYYFVLRALHIEQGELADRGATKFAQEATGVFRGLTECQSGPTKGSKSPLATVEGTPLCKKSVGELVKSIPIPTVSFNAVYQLCHIYRHLFDEGIGLRQLLDYYFVLRALHLSGSNSSNGSSGLCGGLNCPKGIEPIEPLEPLNPLNQAQAVEPIEPLEPQKAEIMHTLSRFGMRKFASATMFVLQTVFAMPDEYLICQPNEKEGKFLLNEIMQAGNFGKYDDRIKHGGSQLSHAIEKTKHNLRLLSHYPEEVLSEPFFRIYHYLWRKLELWRF